MFAGFIVFAVYAGVVVLAVVVVVVIVGVVVVIVVVRVLCVSELANIHLPPKGDPKREIRPTNHSNVMVESRLGHSKAICGSGSPFGGL